MSETSIEQTPMGADSAGRDGRSLTVAARKGKTYWRSLNELADKPELRELVEREFPSQASEWLDGKTGGESRRTFLKIMGASVALAGLASCRRWPGEELVPYSHRPVGRMDGIPVHYMTACEVGGIGMGLTAVSFDGRPIKVDGAPAHPLMMGASDRFVQASVLNVYDPDRSRGVMKRVGGKRTEGTWKEVGEELKKLPADGTGLVVLSEATRSPSVMALRKKLSKAQWFEWEPISNENQRAGAKLAFGKPLRAVPQLDKATVIVSIDADLFGPGEGPMSIKYNRDFAAGRRLHDSANASKAEMNRLYVVEAGFSITGSMADHRRGVRASQVAEFVNALSASLAGAAEAKGELAAFTAALAKDLLANKGKAVVLAGNHQPAEIHAAVAAVNAALNAPVDYFVESTDPRGDAWTPRLEQIQAFKAAAGTAEMVLILGANPVLTVPADMGVEEAIKKAKVSVHAGNFEDETAEVCHWHVPLAHYLEAWGDVRAQEGSVSVIQPLIEPIFGGKSAIEILSMVGGEGRKGFDIVQETAKNDYLGGRFSDWTWKKALFDGIIDGTGWAKETVGTANAQKITGEVAGKGHELVLMAGGVYDGRYANNGWLQELPDPMTRVSWENPVIIAPATAKELGVDGDDVVTLKVGGKEIKATVFMLPGQPEGVLSIAVGYGRQNMGSVADGVGSDAYSLRTSKDGAYLKVEVTRTGEVRPLACVQDHHTVDAVGKGRLNKLVPELVVEGTFEEYRKRPGLGTRKVISLSMFNERSYEPGEPWLMAKWGMAIDLTACTGCSACVIACQAENNIPVVGREMVWRGREMQWLRIDRYFKFAWDEKTDSRMGSLKQGEPLGTGVGTDEVQVVHQPVLCMHCENAPCEEVCPVAATTHSHEGLNMMTYNRCIGTRYCSNNCPYKVRRFNFFDYNAGTTKNLYVPNLLRTEIDELSKMQKNPQVTVRSRGIMEKCTYCVQRIETARINLRAEHRTNAEKVKFADGSVVTACQQACPTQAIAFGDLNDKTSRVAKLHAQAQSYGMLDPELNTKPRTQYLAKVRNPVAGLDKDLYNEHTASEGWYYDQPGAGEKTGVHKD